jgi:hypothetical protein
MKLQQCPCREERDERLAGATSTGARRRMAPCAVRMISHRLGMPGTDLHRHAHRDGIRRAAEP